MTPSKIVELNSEDEIRKFVSNIDTPGICVWEKTNTYPNICYISWNLDECSEFHTLIHKPYSILSCSDSDKNPIINIVDDYNIRMRAALDNLKVYYEMNTFCSEISNCNLKFEVKKVSENSCFVTFYFLLD